MGGRVDVGGEVLDQHGRAVVADDGNFVGVTADDRLNHRSERAVLRELTRAGAAALDVDDQGERLAASVLLERKFLRNAVVSKDEVVGLEREDEFAGLIADQGRNENQSRLAADRRCLRGGLLRRLLRECGGNRSYTSEHKCDTEPQGGALWNKSTRELAR